MDSALVSAHSLVILLLTFLPHQELKDSFCVLVASFLDPDYVTTPWRTRWKSPAALSRFLNHGHWSIREAIRQVRRPPLLQVVLDLTSITKTGHFPRYRHWLFPYHKVRGLHLVVDDIAATRDALLARGVEVGAIDDVGGGVKMARFADPDGNSWLLQEVPANLAPRG